MVVIPPKSHKGNRREKKTYLPFFKRERKKMEHNETVDYLLINHKLICSEQLQAKITRKFTSVHPLFMELSD